jgi:excisionase family DNA binding protein
MEAEEYITLRQAARLAGYTSAGALYTAVRKGRLKASNLDGGRLLTTRTWLADYRGSRWGRSERPATGTAGAVAELPRAAADGTPGSPRPEREERVLVREAAQRLQVSASRLYQWIKMGRLPAHVLGPRRLAVRLADVEAVLAGVTAPPAAPQPEDYVPPSVAARAAGVRPSLVRYWARGGTVASRPGPCRRLVRFGDVQETAAHMRTQRQPTTLRAEESGGNAEEPPNAAGGDRGCSTNQPG